MAFFEFPHTRTYDSDLGWLIRQCKRNEDAIAALEEWKSSTDDVIGDLEKLIKDIAAGNFPPEIAAGVTKWISEHFYDIVGEMIKMVFFGLTDTGYFVAYIPESWKEISFNTTEYDMIVPGFSEYGHLVLSY